jgi:hypothetical protein
MKLTPLILEKVPLIKQWITTTLEKHKLYARPVANLNFSNLPLYYSKRILNSAKIVTVDKIPIPPFSEMGLGELENLNNFENGSYAGVTYIDTYFLLRNCIASELLHFHELVHIIQWEHLGIDKFLLTYGTGILQYGYIDSPLEVMARKYEEFFNQKTPFYDIENSVRKELDKIVSDIADNRT